jgi:FKBP-type peptidyl-prolyl cis-trans isomerase 2
MKVGDKKSSTFPPAEGYGEPKENLKINLQPGTLPAGAKLDLGYIVVCVHVGACLVLSCA